MDKATDILYWISIAFTIIGLIGILVNLPLGAPAEGASEAELSAYRFSRFLFTASTLFAIFFGSIAILTFFVRRRKGISYDYAFVSGELRVAKIYGGNRRRHILCLHSDDMLRLGDAESESFARLTSDRGVKTIFLTPNATPSKGKFFAYIYVEDGAGKRLFVLECKEELLVHILKFAGRDKLADDYISQSKKTEKT